MVDALAVLEVQRPEVLVQAMVVTTRVEDAVVGAEIYEAESEHHGVIVVGD
jgi:hypothetical protein